jgi:hypothetical protein
MFSSTRQGWRRNRLSEFHRLIEHQIPKLRRYARALTRNRDRADDLVQDTLGRALVKEQLWQPGTNLRAWLFTIMHNQNVNNVRRDLRESWGLNIEQISSTLTAATDPTATRKMFELERPASPASSGAAAGDPACGSGRHVLQAYRRNSNDSGRHGSLAPGLAAAMLFANFWIWKNALLRQLWLWRPDAPSSRD